MSVTKNLASLLHEISFRTFVRNNFCSNCFPRSVWSSILKILTISNNRVTILTNGNDRVGFGIATYSSNRYEIIWISDDRAETSNTIVRILTTCNNRVGILTNSNTRVVILTNSNTRVGILTTCNKRVVILTNSNTRVAFLHVCLIFVLFSLQFQYKLKNV